MIKKNNLNDWPSFDTEEVKLVEEILLTGKVNYWTEVTARSLRRNLHNGLAQDILLL